MARYIDAEQAIHLIENDALSQIYYSKSDAIDCINATPTADVVEVVRCKDCKRCYEKRTKRNNQLMRFCMRIDGNEYQVNANDFCSYGTPKERGNENDIAKSEAIKECLAKVKNYIKTHCNPYGKPDFDYDTSIKILNFIDNILK